MPDKADDRIDFAEVRDKLWRHRADILVCAIVSVLLGILFLNVATKNYTATMVLVPTQSQFRGGLGQLGGLASLAGIDVSGLDQGNSPFTLYPDALKSSSVAEDMARTSPDIMHRLYRKQWDEQGQRWIPPEGTAYEIKSFLKQLVTGTETQWQPPNAVDLQSLISDFVRAVQDIKNPLLTVTFRDPDPAFAKLFLVRLNGSIDRVLRRMTLDRARLYAKYLEEKLPTVQQTDERQVLVESMSTQETLIMMTSSNTSFAAQTLGPPVASLKPTDPDFTIVLLLSAVLGIGIGSAAAFFEISVIGVVISCITWPFRTFSRKIPARHGS